MLTSTRSLLCNIACIKFVSIVIVLNTNVCISPLNIYYIQRISAQKVNYFFFCHLCRKFFGFEDFFCQLQYLR